MIPPGSDCWGRAPVTPHSPAHSKISYVISYMISYMISYNIKDFICNIINDIIYDIISHETYKPDGSFPESGVLPG
jgi:hypothetical protein